VDRGRILLKLRERIIAFAASRIGRDAAEDVAQEVMLLLEEKYAAVDNLSELLPLSLRIARFKMMAWRRKTARHGEYSQVSVDDLPLPDPGLDPLEQAERRETVERLEKALAAMGRRCRELFREIRKALGVKSLNTVYTWDFRCRQRLLELLGGSYDARRR
jgi:RNA polymerase sigma-70 factor (ECF subfamily)